MSQITLSASVRESSGKGAANKLRRSQQIPAILYGPNTTPLMLTVRHLDLRAALKAATGENVILGLQIDKGNGSETKTVMVKELQEDPIKPIYYHVDFYEISMDKELEFDIPIHLVNTPVGVTNGGILQHVKREVNVSCLPRNLVDFFEIDVSRLEIGDSVHIKDIVFPPGIQSNEEEDMTVAVVNAPSIVAEKVEEVPEEEMAAAAEEGAPAPETPPEEEK
ncbi:MAG: 50S ribosomal protein L25 [Deltaproteobacteria bacterium]|nr:50S ribosomal protein L25 [Deltaproteobacteria bacterium]